MTRKEIETYLISKPGYLKKSGIEVAKAIWKLSSKHTLPKNKSELEKDLKQIKEIQINLRKAKTIQTDVSENQLLDIYQKIIDDKNKPKRRIFFDIEVSPNIVFSWRIGNKVNLIPDNIIQERAIICIAWKFEGEEKIHSLQWDKGCDKDLLIRFAKIIDGADEVIGQNSDNFDIKWIRTRCILHNIPISPKFSSIDTLKMARSGFKFNSNKLDYMAKFLGFGGKINTSYDLWRKIVLDNDKTAMNDMVTYCKMDVKVLEDVYLKLRPFCPEKKFRIK